MDACMKSVAAVLVILCGGAVQAQPSAAPQPLILALPTLPVDELAAPLRQAVLRSLPKDLEFEASDNWGHQAKIPSIQGLQLIHVMRNHGDWQRARVVAHDVPARLQIRLGDLYSVADNRIVFTVHMTTPARVDLQKEIWQDGIRVYENKVAARFQLSAVMTMEASLDEAAKDPAGLQLTRATFSCKRFVAENVNGVGGDLGRLAGDAVKGSFKPWQPVVLGEFQKSINGAVMAADADREMRAGLSKLLLRAGVARTAFQRNQATVTATQFDRAAQVPVVEMVSVPIMPFPFLFGSFTLEIPLSIHPADRVGWHDAPLPEHLRYPEHSGLAEHSIHYEHSGHSSSGGSHPSPTHRR